MKNFKYLQTEKNFDDVCDCSYKKMHRQLRVDNLLFASAVLASFIFTSPSLASASEVKIDFDVNKGNSLEIYASRRSGNSNQTILPPSADENGIFPTLEKFLDNLICTACSRRCPLTAPECGIGVRLFNEAVRVYEDSVPAGEQSDSFSKTAPDTNTSEDTTETQLTKPPLNNSDLEDTTKTDDAELEKYLKNLFCTACSRHCPLTALECSRGIPYLEKAKSEFMALNSESPASEKTSSTKLESVSSNTKPLDLAMNYMPFAGLLVGGIYYTNLALKKQKRR